MSINVVVFHLGALVLNQTFALTQTLSDVTAAIFTAGTVTGSLTFHDSISGTLLSNVTSTLQSLNIPAKDGTGDIILNVISTSDTINVNVFHQGNLLFNTPFAIYLSMANIRSTIATYLTGTLTLYNLITNAQLTDFSTPITALGLTQTGNNIYINVTSTSDTVDVIVFHNNSIILNTAVSTASGFSSIAGTVAGLVAGNLTYSFTVSGTVITDFVTSFTDLNLINGPGTDILVNVTSDADTINVVVFHQGSICLNQGFAVSLPLSSVQTAVAALVPGNLTFETTNGTLITDFTTILSTSNLLTEDDTVEDILLVVASDLDLINVAVFYQNALLFNYPFTVTKTVADVFAYITSNNLVGGTLALAMAATPGIVLSNSSQLLTTLPAATLAREIIMVLTSTLNVSANLQVIVLHKDSVLVNATFIGTSTISDIATYVESNQLLLGNVTYALVSSPLVSISTSSLLDLGTMLLTEGTLQLILIATSDLDTLIDATLVAVEVIHNNTVLFNTTFLKTQLVSDVGLYVFSNTSVTGNLTFHTTSSVSTIINPTTLLSAINQAVGNAQQMVQMIVTSDTDTSIISSGYGTILVVNSGTVSSITSIPTLTYTLSNFESAYRLSQSISSKAVLQWTNLTTGKVISDPKVALASLVSSSNKSLQLSVITSGTIVTNNDGSTTITSDTTSGGLGTAALVGAGLLFLFSYI